MTELALIFAAIVALAFVAGTLFGHVVTERLFVRARRFERTGTPEKAEAAVAPSMPVHPEIAAQLRASQHAIEKGADALQEAGKEQGMPLSRKDAIKQARDMIEQQAGGLFT